MEKGKGQRGFIKKEVEEPMNETAMASPPGLPLPWFSNVAVSKGSEFSSVCDWPRSSLRPFPDVSSTGGTSKNVPSSDTRALASQSELDMEEMKRQKSRRASREARKRKKEHLENLERSCKEKDLKIESLTLENHQLLQRNKKMETAIALLKDNQNEAMKILARGLLISE